MSNRTALASGILLALVLCAGLAVWLGGTGAPASTPDAGIGRGAGDQVPVLEVEPEIAAPGRPAERTETAAPADVVAEEGAEPGLDAIVLTLVVQDVEGAPLEGAAVSVIGKERVELAAIETSADGIALVTLPGAGDVWVHAVAEGYEHATIGLPLTGSRRHVLGLRRLAELEGRVLDAASGEPIGGAGVERVVSPCEACPPCSATSDAGGRFTLDCVPLEGDHPVERRLSGAIVGTWIRAFAEGYASEQRALILQEPGTVLEFRLLPGSALSFRVRDQGTGLPLAGTRIESTRGDLVETDAHGEAHSTAMLAAGGRDAIGLTCRSDRHASLSFRIDPLIHDPERPIELELPALAHLSVTISDPDGSPVAASVSLYPTSDLDRTGARPEANLGAGWSLRAPGRPSTTDSSVLFDALPETEHRLKVSAAGYAPQQLTVTTPNPGMVAEQAVVLVPEAIASGRLSGRLHSGGLPFARSIHWSGPTRNGSARSASDGSFEATGVEPGPIVVRVSDSFFDRELEPSEWKVDVVAGETTYVDLDLDIPTTTIEGRVLRADGTPAGGRSVWARAEDARITLPDTTDARGHFVLTVQADVDAYMVSAQVGPRASGVNVELEGVAPGATGVELVLPELAELRWRAIEADTERVVDRAEFLWARAGEELRDEHAIPDAEGWHRIELPTGTYDLGARQARGSLLPVLRERVDVHPGMPPITFELEPSHELVVELADGQPEDLKVAILLLDERQDALLPRDSLQSSTRIFLRGRPTIVALTDGPARLTGLAPGRHRFRAFPDVIAIEPAEVVVGPDTPEVELRWRYR